jgi:alpha-galactosidase
MTRIFQVFEACDLELDEPRDRRWIKLTLSLGELEEEKVAQIDRMGPQYHMREEWKRVTQRKTGSAKREGSHA